MVNKLAALGLIICIAFMIIGLAGVVTAPVVKNTAGNSCVHIGDECVDTSHDFYNFGPKPVTIPTLAPSVAVPNAFLAFIGLIGAWYLWTHQIKKSEKKMPTGNG